MQTSPYSTASKYRQNRTASFGATKEIWTKSVPWLELDDRCVDAANAPAHLPKSVIVKDDLGYLDRKGVAIVAPSPWVDKEVNARAARFWRANGFELRTWENCYDISEGYVKEWVRMCDVPLRGRKFSAKAWLDWVTRKYKELYLA